MGILKTIKASAKVALGCSKAVAAATGGISAAKNIQWAAQAFQNVTKAIPIVSGVVGVVACASAAQVAAAGALFGLTVYVGSKFLG